MDADFFWGFSVMQNILVHVTYFCYLLMRGLSFPVLLNPGSVSRRVGGGVSCNWRSIGYNRSWLIGMFRFYFAFPAYWWGWKTYLPETTFFLVPFESQVSADVAKRSVIVSVWSPSEACIPVVSSVLVEAAAWTSRFNCLHWFESRCW